jgi:hypothetical protein
MRSSKYAPKIEFFPRRPAVLAAAGRPAVAPAGADDRRHHRHDHHGEVKYDGGGIGAADYDEHAYDYGPSSVSRDRHGDDDRAALLELSVRDGQEAGRASPQNLHSAHGGARTCDHKVGGPALCRPS